MLEPAAASAPSHPRRSPTDRRLRHSLAGCWKARAWPYSHPMAGSPGIRRWPLPRPSPPPPPHHPSHHPSRHPSHHLHCRCAMRTGVLSHRPEAVRPTPLPLPSPPPALALDRRTIPRPGRRPPRPPIRPQGRSVAPAPRLACHDSRGQRPAPRGTLPARPSPSCHRRPHRCRSETSRPAPIPLPRRQPRPSHPHPAATHLGSRRHRWGSRCRSRRFRRQSTKVDRQRWYVRPTPGQPVPLRSRQGRSAFCT